MKQLGLMVDLKRCIGCKTCIVACRNNHDLVDHANAMPNELPYYLRVIKETSGKFPELSQRCYVIPCQHCKEPECMTNCRFEAISKDKETGIVQIDKDKCKGCKLCTKKCPYEVIQFNKEARKAHKCNLCYSKIIKGETTVCAETCLTDAVSFGEITLLKQKALDSGRKIVADISKESILYIE